MNEIKIRWNEARTRYAIFSTCEAYRYELLYSFGWEGPEVVFLMLNPSTADELGPDPTVRRCMGFARRLGASTLRVVNMFGLRSTDPLDLLEADDPVGPWNDRYITSRPREESLVICAWGEPSKARLKRLVRARAARVVELLRGRTLYALAVTKSGAPRHPLYLRADSELMEWRPEDYA